MAEWKSNWFYGNKLTEEEIEAGFMSYGTFAKAFPHILNNNLITSGNFTFSDWELVNGSDYDEETDSCVEIYQYYIVPEYGAYIIKEFIPDSILYYNEELDIYLWGITHWGTSWDGVSTSIKLNIEEN